MKNQVVKNKDWRDVMNNQSLYNLNPKFINLIL